LKGRDLIFMEERGTRFAKPFLFCPEHHVHNIAVAKGEIPYTDASWIKACNQRLKAQGINPPPVPSTPAKMPLMSMR
jgi:hypothetical protein